MNVRKLPRHGRSLTEEHAAAPGNAPRWEAGRMYAIAFDLDTEILQQRYGSDQWRNAYDSIRRIFEKHGFTWTQGSLYFGHDRASPVHCVLAVQDVSNQHPWFRFAVRDIRMLRIEENNDLMPAIKGQGELRFDADSSAA